MRTPLRQSPPPPCWTSHTLVSQRFNLGIFRKVAPNCHLDQRKFLASQERVPGFPDKGADLQGDQGNLRGSSGKLPKILGKFRGTSGLLYKLKSERASGEVSGELPGKSQRLAKFVFNGMDPRNDFPGVPWIALLGGIPTQ